MVYVSRDVEVCGLPAGAGGGAGLDELPGQGWHRAVLTGTHCRLSAHAASAVRDLR